MADIEVVIKIPEDIYKTLKTVSNIVYGFRSGKTFVHACLTAIRNGTPLPKGHGRLIDANKLRSMYSINRANFNTVVGIQKWIDEAPTIIEADKEGKK